MIKYSLVCECEAEFEGWFPSSKDYERQLVKGLLVCPMCDSNNVRKALQKPNIGKKTNQKSEKTRPQISGEHMVMGGSTRTILKKIQDHVEKNFENVGKNFAKEARKASKGERNEDFYGTANKKEVKELVDEGIDLFAVPKVKDN